ncbi:hypothetical protein V496_02126 [Pseudogymnoascus sp. VKM F-4515 (FW-2607)]|nr:hypothetical protein V496_02126 [Pseudogymnoascus sp. VKM F-4515 (FW-2607)]
MTIDTLAGHLETYAEDMGVMLLNIETTPYRRLLGTLKNEAIDASPCCNLDSRVLYLEGFDAGIIVEQSQAALSYLSRLRGNGSMLAWVCWDEFVILENPFGVRWTEKCNETHIASFQIIMKPITRASDRFFDNVTVTLKDWHLPYQGKHHYKLHFDLKNRTFRVATAATRETWYIVMHPIVAPVMELDGSRRKRLERQAKPCRSSALLIHHAQAMASHIKHVFLSRKLFGELEASWGLNSTLSQKLTCNKWTKFQERFMESWPEHLARHSYDVFWMENEPVFHAYDYGANIEIEVSEGLQSLGRETRLRPREDSDDEADADAGGDEESAAGCDESQPRSPRGGGQTEGRQSVGGAQVEWPLDPNSSPDGLYSDGLTQLHVIIYLLKQRTLMLDSI